MTAYLLDRARVLAPGTAERYARYCDLFMRYLGAGARTATVAALTQQALRDFYSWLRRPETGLHGRQRSTDTTRKAVEGIQLVWSWLADDDAFMKHVTRPRSIEMLRSLPAPAAAPTWQEMDRAVEAADTEWHRQLITILRFTGLRAAQGMMVLWADVDLVACTLHVTGGKSRQEKAGRIIPIAPAFAAVLAGWGTREGYLVKSGRTGARHRQPRDRDMDRIWARSGVREAAWSGQPHHAFRKGFMSGLKRAGADDEAVKYLVGHSLGLRGRYVTADSLPLREAVLLVPALSPPTNIILIQREQT